MEVLRLLVSVSSNLALVFCKQEVWNALGHREFPPALRANQRSLLKLDLFCRLQYHERNVENFIRNLGEQ